MSKKITEAMLKGLVERVLSEEQLNEFSPIPMKRRNKDDTGYTRQYRAQKDIKKDLGSNKIATSFDDLKDLAKKHKNSEEAELSLDDFKAAFRSARAADKHGAPKAHGAQAAYKLMKDPKLRPDIKTATEKEYKNSQSWQSYVSSRANLPADPDTLKYNEKMPNRVSGQLGSALGQQNVRELRSLLNNAATSTMHKDYLVKYINHSKEFARNAVNIMKSLVQAGELDSNDQFYLLAQAEYNKNEKENLTAPSDRDSLRRKTLTAPEISTQGIESGKMLASQFHMFDKFIQGTGGTSTKETLKNRVKKMTDFSDELFNLNEASTPTSSDKYFDFFNKTMMMDYINKMVFEMDSMSGAYTFEAFCAYLAGGISGGKTKGLSGKMGATDFSTADGGKGSAKYLKTMSEFKQSAGDFVVNQPITYIFASKRDSNSKGISSPDQIHEIEMYVVEAKLIDETTTPHKFEINGETRRINQKEGSYIFQANDADSAGTLRLRTSSKDLVTDNLTALANGIGSDVKTAFESFKITMTDLLKAKDNIEIYVQKGAIPDPDDASKDVGTIASEKLQSANVNFDKVKATISSAPASTPVTESKKVTAGMLKKLIQEKFKK
jgi:hypothetical protein